MLRELIDRPRVVGVKQLRKAIEKGQIGRVFLAEDADPAVTGPIACLAASRGIAVDRVDSMKELGRACGIAVGASAAGLLNRDPGSPV